MVIHYFTLRALCEELSLKITGGKVQEIFTQKKSELVITFSGDSTLSLLVSIEPRHHYFFYRSDFGRAKRNSSDLFAPLIGAAVSAISIAESDRVITIEFPDRRRLAVQLFNSAASNVVLVGEDGIVAASFKHNRELQGNPFTSPPPRSHGSGFSQEAIRREILERDPGLSVIAALMGSHPLLGSTYAKEILFRSGQDGDRLASSLSGPELAALSRSFSDFMSRVLRPDPHLYRRDGGETLLSIVPLESQADIPSERCSSVNEAVRRSISREHHAARTDDRQLELDRRLRSELARAEKTRSFLVADLRDHNRGDEYALFGKTLLANLHLLSKGMSAIELPDALDSDLKHRITLDVKLTPVHNAERYFEKSRKARTRRVESADRLASTENTLAQLRGLLDELEKCASEDELKTFRQRHHEELRRMNMTEDTPGKELPPFRVFTVAGGFEVWVGKSSANNDLLTMKYAKPEDLWFHVRGASGSHTVLRVAKGKEPPPREAIRQAASIAVYYSKMRKAGNVPVAYCQRKYVRKPKGAAAGSVTLERETVVFVQPGLPQ